MRENLSIIPYTSIPILSLSFSWPSTHHSSFGPGLTRPRRTILFLLMNRLDASSALRTRWKFSINGLQMCHCVRICPSIYHWCNSPWDVHSLDLECFLNTTVTPSCETILLREVQYSSAQIGGIHARLPWRSQLEPGDEAFNRSFTDLSWWEMCLRINTEITHLIWRPSWSFAIWAGISVWLTPALRYSCTIGHQNSWLATEFELVLDQFTATVTTYGYYYVDSFLCHWEYDGLERQA